MLRPRVFLLPVLRLPYFHLLGAALEAAGWQVTHSSSLPRRGIFFDRVIDVLHLHMVDFAFPRRGLDAGLGRFLWFLWVLVPVLQLRGGRLVWTCHELTPHEGDRKLAGWMTRRVARRANAIIVHNHALRRHLLEFVGGALRTPIHVLPHGSLEPYYPPATPTLRPSTPDGLLLFAAIGYMRENKGTDIILTAFRRLESPRARLIVAGNCNDGAYFERLRRIASGDSRIVLRRHDLSDQEIAELHRQADAVLFAFRECPTSGSLITAMSLGSCVIAPRLGHAAELLDEEVGLLFDPTTPVEDLLRCLRAALADPTHLRERGRAARERLRSPDWTEIARDTTQIYSGSSPS